jgi:hypothetical protein
MLLINCLFYRWNIVIHGGIDGYSRVITFLKASNNNRSATVFQSFVTAVTQYGTPSRIRTDCGGENTDTHSFINIYRGEGRGSGIKGKSVHNQRIERLWLDMWENVASQYHELFTFLETEGILHSSNDQHLWALHYVYLPRINQSLDIFLKQWNNHKLRTEHHKTPLKLFFTGVLRLRNSSHIAIRELFYNTLNHARDHENESEQVVSSGEVEQEQNQPTDLEQELGREQPNSQQHNSNIEQEQPENQQNGDDDHANTVFVRDVQLNLSNEQLQLLRDTVNTLQDIPNDRMGISLYTRTLEILNS